MAVEVDGASELTFSTPERLFHVRQSESGRGTAYAATPDGQRFLTRTSRRRSLHLVQQWTELLRE